MKKGFLIPALAVLFLSCDQSTNNTKQSAVLSATTLPVVNNTWSIQGFDGTTTSSSASIIWQTPGVATTAVLNVGTDPANLTLMSVSVGTASDTQLTTVAGLAPDTVYYFQVIATDANGRVVTSTVLSKRTKIQ